MSTERTFPVFVTCVRSVGRLGTPLASLIFCRFFETIHDPLNALQSPLGPNMNSCDALRASREPTFPLSVTVWAQCSDWAYHWLSLFFADFFIPFTTLSLHYPAPLGPNVNIWATLKTSTEHTLPVFVTCVGPVGRLGIPMATPIFC